MDAPLERVRDPAHVEYGELPEVARALRALGSSRQNAGSFQLQFFHALLEARRRAADARSVSARLRAFDASELTRALDRTIERIVLEWPDKRESVRRALRAQLHERANPYSTALTELATLTEAALAADEDAQLTTWRAWTTQLAAVFVAADRSWTALRGVVRALPRQ